MQQSNFALLYAEDDETVREGYSVYFSQFFNRVYTTSDGKRAWELYNQNHPDVVILDINMPSMTGLEIAQKIRSIDTECKIIMLTAYSDSEKLLTAIKLNLTEYLVKPAKRQDLEKSILTAIEELEKKQTKVVKLKHGYTWDINTSRLLKKDKMISLTRKEIALFNLLSSNLINYFSNEEIMRHLYNEDYQHVNNLDTSKYRTLLYRLKNKLGYDLIESNYGVGYKLKLAK